MTPSPVIPGYGKHTLPELSKRLTTEFGRGYSRSNLENMRRFYIEYQKKPDLISQTLSGNLPGHDPDKLSNLQEQPARLKDIFTLSWSHYVFLLQITDSNERQFYEIESTQNHWSLSELKRQFNAGLYERLALSRDNTGVHNLALQGQIIESSDDIIKDPYILEFLGLEEREQYP